MRHTLLRNSAFALASLFAGLFSQTAQAQWRLGYVNSDALSASSFPWSYYTHVAVLGLNCNGSGSLYNQWGYSASAWAAYRTAATANGVKLLLLLGGDMSSCTTSGALSGYVSQIVGVMNGTNTSLDSTGTVFDGVTLDWEAGIGTGVEGQYENLISSLRSSMGSKVISIAGWRQQVFLDVLLNQASHIDMFLNEMYDSAVSGAGNNSGQEWSWYNLANTNLDSGLNSGSAEGSANWYVAGGFPMSKIAEGIPLYGYLYSGCTHSEVVGCTASGTQYDYRTIRNNPSWWNSTHGNDARNGSDYILPSSGGYVTYTDTTQIGQLTSWGKSVGLGGYFVWEVDFEALSGGSQAANFPLSAAIFSGSSGGGGGGSVPAISSFSASPSTITAGASSTLSWSITGATSISINNGVGTVTGTSKVVSPATTTTYVITATDSTGSSTASTTVTVNPAGTAPTISSFSASPSSISSGSSATLSWATTGATSLSIAGIGTVTGTSHPVSPTVTTTYVLTATNSFGSTTKSATVTVTPASLPVISSFIANPSTITLHGSSTLSWTTSGASSLSINGATVTGTTSLSVSPRTTTAYVLTATNGAGSVTQSVTVTVNALTPPSGLSGSVTLSGNVSIH